MSASSSNNPNPLVVTSGKVKTEDIPDPSVNDLPGKAVGVLCDEDEDDDELPYVDYYGGSDSDDETPVATPKPNKKVAATPVSTSDLIAKLQRMLDEGKRTEQDKVDLPLPQGASNRGRGKEWDKWGLSPGSATFNSSNTARDKPSDKWGLSPGSSKFTAEGSAAAAATIEHGIKKSLGLQMLANIPSRKSRWDRPLARDARTPSVPLGDARPSCVRPGPRLLRRRSRPTNRHR